MFGLGITEILIIAVLILILFGAGKLPKVMEDLGKGITAFKEGAGITPAPTNPPKARSKTPQKKSKK